MEQHVILLPSLFSPLLGSGAGSSAFGMATVLSFSLPARIAAPFSRPLRQFVNSSIERLRLAQSELRRCLQFRSCLQGTEQVSTQSSWEVKNGRIDAWERGGCSNPTSSCPVALFVFLPAAARAGIVAPDFVLGTVGRSRRSRRLVATIQGELGLWT